MDLDSFVAVRQPRWERLQHLSRQSKLSGSEADEFARLYQLTATDLSELRSTAPDPAVVSRLSVLLANSRAALVGARQPVWREIAVFFVQGLPAALYRIRWWTIAVMVGFLIIATATAVYLVNSPEALNQMMSAAERENYAEEAFAQYYSEYPDASFFARVWSNNAWVAAQSIAGGFTGIFTVYVQYANAVAVGNAAAIMAEHGYLDIFFQLILPHGMLELTAIWVAGAAGLRIFWTILVPGHLPRLQAMAQEGRTFVGVAVGLAIVLMISGVIEGYVTGSSLPWEVKNAIGACALILFWVYVWVLGGRAYRAGHMGDISEDYREDVVPVAG